MSNENTLVVLRHGIRSDKTTMADFVKHLDRTLPGCRIDNESYDWGEFVLHSGIDLAGHVMDVLAQDPKLTKVIFIGHSQGGLVCRVAVATLCARADLIEALRFRGTPHGGYYTDAEQSLKASLLLRSAAQLDAARDAVHSVVMLGTPNAGAVTNGQMAIEAALLARAARKIGSLRWKNFDELTSDRLFTILQKVRVRRVRYVSVSGSSVNRYSDMASGHLSLQQIPILSRLAPSLDLPNDVVVEDASVDLREAPLPPEIADMDKQYQHVRSYTECIRISHFTVHSDTNALEALDNVPGWR